MDERLRLLAKMVKPNSRVADIGTDHAYLPINLLKSGKVIFAIASDVAPGPFQRAKSDIAAAGLTGKVSLRLGDGLSVIKREDRVDTVIIAGMGGKLITNILTEAGRHSNFYQHLILEPNTGEELVRKWLQDNFYQIRTERLIMTAGHFYELIAASRVKRKVALSPRQLLFGPVIWRRQRQDNVFKFKWQHQLNYCTKLLTNLNKARKKDTSHIAHVKKRIALIKEALANESERGC